MPAHHDETIRSRSALGRASDARWLQLLAGLFVLSRGAFYGAGLRFDLRPLDTSWHIIDPLLLRTDLLRSVLYTPGQPPLYNLLLGTLLKLGGEGALLSAVFHAVYSAMALATCLLLFRLLRGLGVQGWLSFVASSLFMLSPALVLYENIPYYSIPVLFLLTSTSVLFQRALVRPEPGPLLALFCTMAALIYTRSLFQVYWFVALAGFCLLVLPGRRRHVLLAALAPLLLIVALYVKNGIVTGHFATSSWLGMSAVKLSVHQLPMRQREELVARGRLTELALRDTTYDPPEALAPYFARTRGTGIPVLDQPFKSTRHSNYHNLAYVAVSRDELHDALYVMSRYPRVYLRSVGEAFLMFMRPASDYPYLRPNRDAIEPWGRVYARVFAGQPRYPVEPYFVREPGTIGYLLLVGYALCVGFGLVTLLRLPWRTGSAPDLTVLFMWLTIMYVSLVGNALEIGENQRFRFSLHPLLIACLTLLVSRCWQAQQERGSEQARARG